MTVTTDAVSPSSTPVESPERTITAVFKDRERIDSVIRRLLGDF